LPTPLTTRLRGAIASATLDATSDATHSGPVTDVAPETLPAKKCSIILAALVALSVSTT